MPELDPIEHALKHNDPRPLAELDIQRLEKLRIAEEILEARFHAQKRSSRIAVVSSALVGYVALAGFFANAYQNYLNKQHLKEQGDKEEVKWKQEFARGEKADKYKAFFENSQLVTDPQNPERRLIGYALMDEFVASPDYHDKAVAILEQSLNRELRESAAEPPMVGLSEAHRIAVQQIVRAMSASISCHDFEYAARSISGIVAHARNADLDETRELFALYARRLVGRSALVCHQVSDFDDVRQPIREALKRVPAVAGLGSNASNVDANAGVTKLLVDSCVTEQTDFGSPECGDIKKKYQALCADAHKNAAEWKEEEKACALVDKWPDPPPVVIEAAEVPAPE